MIPACKSSYKEATMNKNDMSPPQYPRVVLIVTASIVLLDIVLFYRFYNTLPYEPKVVMGLSMPALCQPYYGLTEALHRDRYGNNGSCYGRAVGSVNTEWR